MKDVDALNLKYKTQFSTTFDSAYKLVSKTEQPKKRAQLQGIRIRKERK